MSSTHSAEIRAEIVRRSFELGESYSVIATKLNVPRGTVASTIYAWRVRQGHKPQRRGARQQPRRRCKAENEIDLEIVPAPKRTKSPRQKDSTATSGNAAAAYVCKVTKDRDPLRGYIPRSGVNYAEIIKRVAARSKQVRGCSCRPCKHLAEPGSMWCAKHERWAQSLRETAA